MSAPVTIAILAAGGATRFGGGKLDVEFLGRRLGDHALEAALELDMGQPLIVVGDPVPEFAGEAARRGRARLAINPDAGSGLATSIALAARSAAEAGSEALLLTLADMPQVGTETLAKLVEAASQGYPAASRHESGHPGIPACFPVGWFEALQGLEGDSGAASLLGRTKKIALLDVPHDELVDVDTEEDLDLLKARHRL